MPSLTVPLAAAAAAALAVAVPSLADSGRHHEGAHHERGAHHDHGVHHDRGARAHTLLRAHIAPSVPNDPAIFGVKPGGAPWTIAGNKVEVRTDGRIELRVHGLVIPPQGNTNPVPQAAVTLFCNGAKVDTIGPVRFSAAGDIRVKGRFANVPQTCLAPVVFVNPKTPATTDENLASVYIAASGFSADRVTPQD